MVDESTGQLAPKYRNRIVTLINLGVADLHMRFNLKEDVLTLKVTEDIKRYLLTPENAVSNNPDGYIQDSAAVPFKGNIVEILRIRNPDGAYESINTEKPYIRIGHGVYHNVHSTTTQHAISTPSFNELLFRHIPKEGNYEIIYKADVLDIPLDGLDDLSEITVDLPSSYLNALCYFVGSKIYNPMGAETIGRSMFHEGNNWRAMYEEECKKLGANLAGVRESIATTNFERNGWV